MGYKIISMDEIIREIAKNHKNGMRITGLYNPGRYLEEKEIVIKKILNIINGKTNNLKNRYIIEGTIWDPKIINAFIKNKTFDIIYKQPKSLEVYKKYMKQRVATDKKNNTTTMSIVWKNLTKEQINNKSIFNKFINQIAYFRLCSLNDDYKIFHRYNFTIIQ